MKPKSFLDNGLGNIDYTLIEIERELEFMRSMLEFIYEKNLVNEYLIWDGERARKELK